jgi:cell division septation protein DedD
MAVGIVLVAATAFAAGAASGGASGAASASRGFTAEVPGDALIDLIARIDASSLPAGGAEALTYQDDLRGPAGAPAEEATAPEAEAAPEPVHIGAGTATVPAVADTPPAGAFTLWIAESADPAEAVALRTKLRTAGHAAWIAAALTDGEPRYTVAVGGYPDAEAAGAGAAAVRGAQVRTLKGGAVGGR